MFQKYYSYDDVLLIPNIANFSLEEMSLETRLIGEIVLKIPIISAAMDTVTEFDMALKLAQLGGAGVIHRNMDPEEQAAEIKKIKDYPIDIKKYPLSTIYKNKLVVGAAVAPQDYTMRLPKLIEAGVDFVVFDVAHSDTVFNLNAIETCKKTFPILIMGGNTATVEATKRLINAGADAIKIGVGAGSICTTRIICGIGIPQLSAVLECSEECSKHNIPSIADGGLRYSGDIVKALGAGASAVMLGNMIAAAEESAGEKITLNGHIFKKYRGMGSIESINKGGGLRYQSEKNKIAVPEGIEGFVPCIGNLESILHQITTGLKKGMWYCGQKNISKMNDYKKFIEITAAGLNESHAHDIYNMQSSPNYKQ